MALGFADIPVVDERLSQLRTRQPTPGRRMLLRTAFTAATAAAFGVLDMVNSAVARAAYFQDWINVSTGPCAPGNYASGHTENGLKCGPSLICVACCWTGATTLVNRMGWHRTGAVPPVEYFQRPDQCWSGSYDSWHWEFSDRRTYRCSDGYRSTSAGTVKTICPWDVRVLVSPPPLRPRPMTGASAQ